MDITDEFSHKLGVTKNNPRLQGQPTSIEMESLMKNIIGFLKVSVAVTVASDTMIQAWEFLPHPSHFDHAHL